MLRIFFVPGCGGTRSTVMSKMHTIPGRKCLDTKKSGVLTQSGLGNNGNALAYMTEKPEETFR